MQKRYTYTYEDYEDDNKTAQTMVEEILADPEFAQVDSLEIGNWGDAWEDNCQPILDGMVANKDAFSHIQTLAIGIMDMEDCEISWIIQGNYANLWQALPNLKHLTIQGSNSLELGEVNHAQLESLEIICGGLPKDVIKSVAHANLPNLRKLVLYLGVEDYGLDATAEELQKFVQQMNFPKLEYFGLLDSEMQDEVAQIVLDCPLMPQLTTLDLSCGVLTDKGGTLLLNNLSRFPKLQKLDLHYHFLSDEMMEKLEALPIEVDLSEQNEAEDYDGELYYYAMITE